MFLSSLKHLRGTVWFRLALWYSGIFVLSSLLLFSLAYFLLASSLTKKDREAIEMRLQELLALYQTGGVAYLEREVTIEKKFDSRESFFVRLAGPGNKSLFLILPYQWADFDIKELERRDFDPNLKWIRLPSKNAEQFLEIGSIRLAKDLVVQAGKSTEERKEILKHLKEIFAAVTVPLFLCGFIGGVILSIRALQPIRYVINTINSISSGRMDARIPSSGRTGNEIDELIMLFNAMAERIESLIEAMRDSLDNVTHDLRTPMTRLRGIAEMTLRSDCNTNGCREALADCLEESERILKMLDALMDISEAETGLMKLQLKSIGVHPMIEDVAQLYRYVAEEKGIDLQTDCADNLSLTADPVRIRQALGNLLDNAIKYTPSGGRVDIAVQQDARGLVITVKDTGMGIPQEALPRIWDRLFRCDQSRSKKGLGLGLSLVRAIVVAHKGQVDVQSEPGKGSSFTVSLPADS